MQKIRKGYVRQRKNGSWEGQYYYQGRLKSMYGKTEYEVRSKLCDTYDSIRDGSYIDPNEKTVAGWLYEWLNTCVIHVVAPSTYTNYETNIRRHLEPDLGRIKLRHLSTQKIQLLINKKAVSGRFDNKPGGLSQKSLRNLKNILHSALLQACSYGLIDNNPAIGIKLPKGKYSEQRVFSKDEKKALTFELSQSEHPVALGIIILLNSGLRKGELLGLRWEHVDWNNNSIHIKETLTRIRHPHNGLLQYKRIDDWAPVSNKTGLYLGPVKTNRANRTVYLTDNAKHALLKLMKSQTILKADSKGSFNPYGFALCSASGRPLDPKYFEVYFHKIVDAAHLKNAHIHATRHTFATEALNKSIDLQAVSGILGHAQFSTTLNMYGHVFDYRMKEVISLMNDK